MSEEVTSYELSRYFFNWCFENPEKVNSNFVALYFFCIEHCNRLGWKKHFGLPTTMAKEAIGISSYGTYIKTLNALIEFGFIVLIEKSRNQFSSNIIALSKNDKAKYKARDKALDKASIKHASKQGEKQHESKCSIDKPITNNQLTIEPLTNNYIIPPQIEWVKVYCVDERKNSVDPEKFFDFYASKNWMVGKNKMKDWQACVRTWEKNDKKFNNGTNQQFAGKGNSNTSGENKQTGIVTGETLNALHQFADESIKQGNRGG